MPSSNSPTRRGVLTATALGGGALAAAPALAEPGESLRPLPPKETAARAAAAASALLDRFMAATDPDMLMERVPRQDGDPEFAYVWPLSQARAAVTELLPSRTQDTALADAAQALLRAQEQYWYPQGGTTGLPGYTAATDSVQGAHGDFFYVDNDWIALLEIEQHLFTEGREGDLDRAGELLELFRSGESTDASLPSPGGIFWTQGD